MADDDLVAQVSIEGTEDATAQIEDLGDKGSEALDKLGESAEKAGEKMTEAGESITKGAEAGAKGLENLKKAGEGVGDPIEDGLKKINKNFEDFGASLAKTSQAITKFVARAATIGTAFAGAGVAFALSAGKIAKSIDDQSDSTKDLLKQQQLSNTESAKASVAAINLGASQDKLRGSYQRGEITYTQYSKALNQSNRDADAAARTASKVAAVQANVKQQNDALAKSVKNNKAYDDLKEKFGDSLLPSVLSFGNAINTVSKQVKDAFGPAIGTVLDSITTELQTNAGAIGAFFERAGAAATKIATGAAPQLKLALENVASAASSVFDGLIAAAPSLLDFFNNQLVPAVKFVSTVFDALATGINAIFGTKLTGGALAIILIFAQLSGAIKLVFTSLKTIIPLFQGLKTAFQLIFAFGSPLLKIIILIVGALVTLYATNSTFRNWVNSFVKGIADMLIAAGGLVPAILGFAAKIIQAFVNAWNGVSKGADEAVASTKAVFSGIGSFFSGIWQSITSGAGAVWKFIADSASAGYDAVVGYWGTITGFFSGLWDSITSGASAVWDAIAGFVSTVVNQIVSDWNGLVQDLANVWAAITAAGAAVWQTIADAVSPVIDTIVGYWNSFVDVLQAVWDAVTQGAANVWNAIKDGFQTAFDYVANTIKAWAATVMKVIQPVIDAVKTTLGLLGGLGGGSSSGTQAFAGGGEVHGRGGPTSDSIPAWLSNSEFVVRAKAVKKYGTAFLHAINSGRFDLSRIAKFAAGGLVGASSPSYAFAGMNGLGGSDPGANARTSVLNLHLDGQVFPGLIAPEETAQNLMRYATAKKARSAGRQPQWRR